MGDRLLLNDNGLPNARHRGGSRVRRRRQASTIRRALPVYRLFQAPRDRNAARPACAHGVLPSPFNDCMHALFATEVERNVRAPDMTVYERCPDLKGLGEGQKPGRGRELLDHLVDIVR